MALSTSLRKAARNLIDQFGNTGTLYSYAGATITTTDEGDKTVTAWPAGTSIKVVDGTNAVNVQSLTPQITEIVGEDEKIIKDSVTIVTNDRLTVDSDEFRVIDIRRIRTQDLLIISIIRVERVNDTVNW